MIVDGLAQKGCYKIIIAIHTYFSPASLELATEVTVALMSDGAVVPDLLLLNAELK